MVKKMVLIMALFAMHSGLATDGDGRPQGGPHGAPGWSARVFWVADTVNKPLDLAVQKISAFTAKSKLMITLLLGYIGFSAKDTVKEHINNAPDAITNLVSGNNKAKKDFKALQPDRTQKATRSAVCQKQCADEPAEQQINASSELSTHKTF